MRIPDNVLVQLNKLQRIALIVGVVAALISIAGLVAEPQRFFRAYLYSYMFWFGLTGGCLAMLMLHHIVGGGWGFIIRRLLEAGTKLLPLAFILFLPLLAGLKYLYPWMHAPEDRIMAWRQVWSNAPFYVLRIVICFLILGTFAYVLNKWSKQQDESNDPRIYDKMTRWSSFGLLVYAIVMSFAVIDLTMSTNSHWYSSMYPAVFLAGQGLSTLTFMLVSLAYLTKGGWPINEVPTKFFRDLANLTLAATLFWAYVSFSEFVIIYAANISESATFYVFRRQGPFWWLIVAIMGLHFFLPFFVLVTGDNVKRSIPRLAQIAFFILLMRWVNLYWIIMPAWPEVRVSPFHWIDFVLPFALGGLWLAAFATMVKRTESMLPVHDPRLEGNWPPLQEVAQHG
jgi:hypothetical protein